MSKSRDIADSAATINYIDNVTSDVQSQINTLDTALDNISVTSGTLTKTFANGESASINLTSSVLAPVVSVTKEVPQSGVTNNSWDVNSTTENYTRLDSAYATTLNFSGGSDVTPSITYTNNSFDYSAQDTNVREVEFKNDGTKMYLMGDTNDTIYQYSLSTPWDVSTASYDSVSYSVSTGATVAGFCISQNGLKIYVSGLSDRKIYEHTLSSAWDLSTASSTASKTLADIAGTATGLDISSDGTKIFILDYAAAQIDVFTMSTPYSIASAGTSANVYSVTGGSNIRGISFTSNGYGIAISNSTNGVTTVGSLTTAFDLSTVTWKATTLDPSVQTGGTVYGLNIRNADKAYYVSSGNDTVYEYDATLPNGEILTLGTGSFASADVGKTIEANSGEFVLTAANGSYLETTAPTSYDQVASGSWSMYGVVYNAADGDLELSSTIENKYDVSTASYSQSFSVLAQDNAVQDLTFNANGTKLYIVGNSANAVYQYELTTAFDVSTASYLQSFSVTSQEGTPTGIVFNTDGTKMFVCGATGDAVWEYVLSTGFDISTASYSQSFSVATQDTSPQGLAFNSNGTKMFVLGAAGDDVNEYTLSTGFDVSTASYSQNFSVATQDAVPLGIAFNSSGTKMFIVGNANDSVYEYTLSTGFDVSTASYSQSFSITQDTAPNGITFNTDGTKMFVSGETNKNIYEYNIGTSLAPTGYHPVHTTTSIDSTYWTDINSMTADQVAGDGNVYYAISTDDRTTWTIIHNTDGERDIVRNNAGTWQYNSNGTYASETWTNATTNTELAALAEAMEGAEGVTINTFDVSTAVYSQNFSVASQEITPSGLTFSTDGTKMFVVGEAGKDVNEYTLSTAFDVSTASYTRRFDVSSRESFPSGIAFNTDGTKMFIVGWNGQEVNEFSLSTGFNVSTASWASLFSVSAQDTSPQDITFNTDGTKMFIVGGTGDAVYEYSLSTGFNISTASYVDSFSVAAQETNPIGIAFNTDGTKMFVAGADGDDVNEYTLSTGFDVSTASFVDSFNVADQDGYPSAVTFNTDGTKMFVLGLISDYVNEYTIGTPSYTNQMDKTQLDAVTDPNHIALGNDLDLAIVFNMTSGTTVPSSDGVAINYDANVLNKGAVLGTDYDFDAPAQNSVRITALAANNLKVRVV